MQETTSMKLRQALNNSRQPQMGVKNSTVKTGLNTMGALSASKNKTTAARFGLQKVSI